MRFDNQLTREAQQRPLAIDANDNCSCATPIRRRMISTPAYAATLGQIEVPLGHGGHDELENAGPHCAIIRCAARMPQSNSGSPRKQNSGSITRRPSAAFSQLPGKVVTMDERDAIAQVCQPERGDGIHVGSIGGERSRLLGEASRDAVQIEAVRVAQWEHEHVLVVQRPHGAVGKTPLAHQPGR
jgi:hypothetical protein